MIALLRREFRASRLWAALQALFGVLANIDHALWRPAHDTTRVSLHVFDGDGGVALSLIEFALAFVMAQRVFLRESEEGSLGALDALPVARSQVYAAKLAACAAMLAVGVAAAFAGNALWMHLARSSLAVTGSFGAHLAYARASALVGVAGVAAGVATAPARNAAFAAVGTVFALQQLVERFAPAARAWNLLYAHHAWRHDDRWLTVLASPRWVLLASASLLLVGAWRFARLARREDGDGVVDRRARRVAWVLGGVVLVPCVCLFGLGIAVIGNTTERVDTRRYRFVLARGERPKAEALLAEADAVYARVRRRFGEDPPAAITVDATQGLAHLGRAGQAAGLAVAIDRATLSDPQRALEVLTHETTHAFENLAARWSLGDRGNETKVFNEGFAFALEHDLTPHARRGDGELVLATLQRRGLLRAEHLVDFEALGAAHDPDLAYPLGEAFVRAMMARWGDDAPVRVLRAFGRRGGAERRDGVALWREVMSDAGMSFDLAAAETFARIEAESERRRDEVEALTPLQALVDDGADGGLLVRVQPEVEAVCRFRDPTMRETDRYVMARAPCRLEGGHFAGPEVQVSVGRVVRAAGESGSAEDDVADVIYEPWLPVRLAGR